MPIDLASGNVHVDYPETRIAGKVELVWGRRFSNALAERHSPFWGPGWTNRYLSTLTRHAGGFEFFGPDGAIEMLPDREHAVQGGEWRRYLHAYIELFLRAGRYVVQRWSAESGEVWRYIFEPTFDGRPMRLSAIEDLSGNRIELQWNSAGKLSGIEQPAEGRTLLLAYSHSGRLLNVRLQGSDGSIHPVTSYEYDAEDRLARASDALQQEDSFAYDAQGRLIREVAKHGGLMSYRYDSSGRCVWQSGSDHYDEKWMRYLDAPRITEMTDSRGATHRYQWLPSGQIVSAWNPLGGHTRTEYDEYGRTTVKTTPEGATTEYGYDERGNRNQIVNALGNTFLLKFNQLHQPVELVDPHGQIWQRHYDSSNRLLASVDPLGGTWRFEYDTRGDAVTLVNPRGDLQRCTYANGSPHRTTDWLGQCTTLEFDAVGRLCSRTDPLGQTWKYTYDMVGNLVRTELPDGAIELASYTAAGDVLRSIDPQGRTKRFRYGPCRRLIQTIDGNDAKISYNWGSEPGFLDSVINEVGDIYRFEYDEAGRCVAEVGFDGRRVEFEYNRDSHCIRTINGAGEIVDHVRDPLGAIVEQRLPGGASVRYVYDKMGELIEGVNADSKVRFDRDTMGRLVGETQGEHWIHYSLDALGVTTSLQTGVGHKASYEIDANGLWSTLTTGQTTEFHFSRDSRTQERFRRFANDTVLATHYDAVGRVVEQTLQARDSAHQPLESRFHRHYARDRSGLVIAIDSEARGRIAFAFDPAEQLLGASRSNGPTEIFEYDSTANLTRKGLGTDFALDNAWISYAPGNRLVSKADDQYEFDAQGRLIQRIEGAHTDHPRKWSFEWDALDQLLSVTRPDGEVWHYAYDAFSRRIAKQSPREKTEYVWSGHVPIHEKSSTDPGWTTNLFAQDSFELVGQIRNGVVFPILSDHLGQAQCMLDDSARVIWQSNSSAFGGSEFHTPDSRSELCNFSFPGQTKDFESGLHYNRFRYYDPSCGRFISQDPLRLPGGANPYLYVPNPIAWIDPWGLICQRLADTLPEEPGIYHIELNGEFYTGSGVNVRTRLSTSDHPAAHLLDDPNVNVMVYPVGLGSAAGDQRMTGHVLRGYEQGVMDQPSIRNTPQQNGSLNQIRAARATRTGEYSQDAANHGAARGGGVPY